MKIGNWIPIAIGTKIETWKLKMKMLYNGLLIVALFLLSGCSAQKASTSITIDDLITLSEVSRIENTLASDEMQGRRAFTPGIEKAAEFIASEFKSIGLQTPASSNGYLQSFALVRAKAVSVSVKLDGTALDPKEFLVFTNSRELKLNQGSGFEKIRIKTGSNLQTEARKYTHSGKNYLVLVDKSFANSFGNLARLRTNIFKAENHVVFILSDTDPVNYEINATHEITEQPLANVVGILPGKSKANEYVIFSAHYDHMGIGKAINGDSIYNGANDNAAGVTAMILLARYFKSINNNERTLIFAAFTAEEIGGYGSQHFSRQYDPGKVMAMFNIEMIGTESKWGKNSAFITGYEKTNMGEILNKDLAGSGFTFYPDPYPAQQLFYRSDNATLARLGVPAHTISTSKMDTEPHYHKPSDHVETLDLVNMTAIIKAIAISSKTIVAGTATPSRVKVEDLR